MTETAIHLHPGQLPPLVPSMGVCMCGHVGAWHTETPGGQWIRGGPCLVSLCACKAYDYAKVSLASLLHENYVAIWREQNGRTEASDA